MEYIFLHHWIQPHMPTYGNRYPPKFEISSSISRGESSNSIHLTLHNHIGTHVDCPYHFDPKGKKLSDYSSEEWIFNNVQLLDLDVAKNEIIPSNKVVPFVYQEIDLLLLRTGVERIRQHQEYWEMNPGLSEELGTQLRQKRPRLKAVGFDFISLSSYQNRALGRKAHLAFLGTQGPNHSLRIIEDMHLAHLTKSPSKIIILPLPIAEADGAPVSVLAELK